MLRIGICDDDLQEAQKIEEYISHMPFHDLETEVFLSGEELLRHHLEDKKYNIILLDIELPSVNGIETAIKLREIDLDMVLIFITAHREYVYKTFEALNRFLMICCLTAWERRSGIWKKEEAIFSTKKETAITRYRPEIFYILKL